VSALIVAAGPITIEGEEEAPVTVRISPSLEPSQLALAKPLLDDEVQCVVQPGFVEGEESRPVILQPAPTSNSTPFSSDSEDSLEEPPPWPPPATDGANSAHLFQVLVPNIDDVPVDILLGDVVGVAELA